jgi:diguanylate cyclase (GGDEF)-like protein
MSEHSPIEAAAAAVSTEDENALLRASLAEAQARIRELEQLVDSDMLTGLPNRRRFEAELERVVGQCDRHGTSAAVLQVDVKGLEAVNRRHGRFAGDAALIEVGKLLSALIRATDMAARTGDDEFCLILDRLDHNSAIETAERLTRCIAAHRVDLGASQVAVEASVATTCVFPGDTAAGVMLRVGRNLAVAKGEI